jgi:hypothetical protein
MVDVPVLSQHLQDAVERGVRGVVGDLQGRIEVCHNSHYRNIKLYAQRYEQKFLAVVDLWPEDVLRADAAGMLEDFAEGLGRQLGKEMESRFILYLKHIGLR